MDPDRPLRIECLATCKTYEGRLPLARYGPRRQWLVGKVADCFNQLTHGLCFPVDLIDRLFPVVGLFGSREVARSFAQSYAGATRVWSSALSLTHHDAVPGVGVLLAVKRGPHGTAMSTIACWQKAKFVKMRPPQAWTPSHS
jgi:hypothetical protein